MANLSPILRDLKPFQKSVPSNICLKEVWEVSDIHDEDIIWNIVMSYLNYYPRNEDNNEVEYRLQTLGVTDKCKSLVSSVKQYNPFLQRNAFYCQKITDCIVEPFKELNYRFAKNYRVLDSVLSFEECLENSSILLRSTILVVTIRTNDNEIYSVEHFPRVRKDDCPDDFKVLIVFRTVSQNSSETFSFAISKEYGLIKQRIALKEIIRNVTYKGEEPESVVKKVLRCRNIQEHFLCSLLKYNLGKYVQEIYRSSYVLTKLRDAGYETNPLAEDDEKNSALYYALCGEDTSLLYFLYDHAANACLMEPCSVRCPDKSTVEWLQKLRSHLIDLRNRENPEDINTFYQGKLDELLRLNSFQIDVCSLINQINEKHNTLLIDEEFNPKRKDSYTQSTEEHQVLTNEEYAEKESNKSKEVQNLLEAKHRKEVILSILETYQKYFSWSGETGVTYDLFLQLKEFSDHNNYFENLDFCATIMFFDKLFLLKERLKFPIELYTQIESKFFFLIYSKKYLIENKKPKILTASEIVRMVPYHVRLNLKNNICTFKEELCKFEVTAETIVKQVPNKAVETLTNLPLIYDEFLISRLIHYLDVAINTTVKEKNTKSVLVVERALQVIGECLTTTKKGFKSVQKILPLIIPKNLKQYVINIRNKLTHFTAEESGYLKTAENDRTMFREIQTEMKHLKEALVPVVETAHAYAIDRFVLTFFYNIIEKASKNILNQENSKESLQNFQNILSSLEEQISVTDEENTNKVKKLRKYFKYTIENIFQSIRSEVNVKKDFTEAEQEMKDFIWCVEFILQYISTDEKLKKYQNSLFQKISERKILFGESQNKIQVPEKYSQNEDIDVNLVLFYGNVSHGKKNIVDDERNGNHENNSSNFDDRKELKKCESHTETLGSKIGKKSDVAVLVKKFEEILNDYEELSKEMLIAIQPLEEEMFTFDFKNLTKLRHILNGRPSLNAEERQELQHLKKRSRDISFAKDEIKCFLEGTKDLTIEELRSEVSLLPLGKKKKKELIEKCRSNPAKYLSTIESVPNYEDVIDGVLRNLEIDSKTCQTVCQRLEASRDAAAVLKKFVIGQHRPSQGSLVRFLRDRTRMLKAILVDENPNIKRLWEKAKKDTIKGYLQERIIELYQTDDEVQASVEMLLLNCMEVLNDKKFQNLLRKATNLFSGINLRNVLAHGNPLLETVGKLVDPTDMPSELVRNLIHLISDDYTLGNMVELLNILKSDFNFFMKVMENSNSANISEEIGHYREEIVKCKHWKGYAELLKRDKAS